MAEFIPAALSAASATQGDVSAAADFAKLLSAKNTIKGFVTGSAMVGAVRGAYADGAWEAATMMADKFGTTEAASKAFSLMSELFQTQMMASNTELMMSLINLISNPLVQKGADAISGVANRLIQMGSMSIDLVNDTLDRLNALFQSGDGPYSESNAYQTQYPNRPPIDVEITTAYQTITLPDGRVVKVGF